MGNKKCYECGNRKEEHPIRNMNDYILCESFIQKPKIIISTGDKDK